MVWGEFGQRTFIRIICVLILNQQKAYLRSPLRLEVMPGTLGGGELEGRIHAADAQNARTIVSKALIISF